MKLLVITREFPPYVVGGISHYLYNLCNELTDRGHEIKVISGKLKYKVDGNSMNKSRVDVEWINYPTPHFHHLFFPFMVRKRLAGRNLGRYDVVLTHTGIPFEINQPVITTLHDMQQVDRRFIRSHRSHLYRIADTVINPTRRLVDQRSLRYANHLIFNSNLNRRMWRTHYDFATPSDVIHNGVDTDIFHPRTNRDGEYVLFVGAGERKGLSNVIDAADRIDLSVKVVGKEGVSGKNIESMGRVDQQTLVEYFTGAIATIHPANFEAFGNVVLESLACGTPVVVSDRCGAAEIVDESCGVVTSNVKKGIQRVRDIPPEACIAKAKKHSWARVARETENVISNVVKNH